MDRYQIARISVGKGIKPLAYSFRSSQSVDRIYQYMKKCVKDGVIFDASNMANSVVESAAVALSKTFDVPIIVASKKDENVFSIVYNYQSVFPADAVPGKYRFGIFMPGVDIPSEMESFLMIRDCSHD